MVTHEHIKFHEGYKAGQKDLLNELLEKLWDDKNLIGLAEPDVAYGMERAIDILESIHLL